MRQSGSAGPSALTAPPTTPAGAREESPVNHLNDIQITRLRTDLLARQEALSAQVRTGFVESQDQHYGDLAGSVHDTADEASADQIADTDAARLDREVGDLRAIEAALARIEKGSYGTCADCGDAILFERLAASPAATRCLPCETRVEHFVLRAPRL